jgi:hypothetical protein
MLNTLNTPYTSLRLKDKASSDESGNDSRKLFIMIATILI